MTTGVGRPAAPDMLGPGQQAANGVSHGRVGAVYRRMGLDPAALAACDGGDRLDRRLVLLHASRRQLAQTRRPGGRGRRLLVAGPWRRLLRDEQIYARPALASR